MSTFSDNTCDQRHIQYNQRFEAGRLRMEEHDRRLAVLEDWRERVTADVKELVDEGKKTQIAMAKVSLIVGLLGALGGAAITLLGRILFK